MTHSNRYRWLNTLFYIGVLAVNTLASTLPLGGNSTGEISDRYQTFLTPAGYAFSIWLLICLLLGGFIVYQLRRAGAERESVRSISPWFIASCVFNMAWLFLWHYLLIELSVAAMALLLITLIVIYRITRRIDRPDAGEKFLVRLPFSLYLGWISVATIINVGTLLVKYNWNGFGLSGEYWAAIMIGVGTLLAIMVSYPCRDGLYPLVFVWAFIAISIEQQDSRIVMITALAGAALLLLYSLWLLFFRSRKRSAGVLSARWN